MEAAQLVNEVENLQTPKREDIKHQSCNPATRRTRSQIAPDWTVKDAHILVNEIAAVEGDCLKALSSYQKWKIIAENCTALDVVRTANQCRRKWDSLLGEYKKIKQSGVDSYWPLDVDRRKELGLPDYFDQELFKGIDDLVRAQEDRSDTEPDTDPEAEADVLDVISESGSSSKRPRRQIKSHRKHGEEEKEQLSAVKISWQKVCAEGKKQIKDVKKVVQEETEQLVAEKLRANAELVHAILRGNLSENAKYGLSDIKDSEAYQTEFTRRQADSLITCLGDVVDNLNQLHVLVQQYE